MPSSWRRCWFSLSSDFCTCSAAASQQLLPLELLVVPLQLGLGHEELADAASQLARQGGQPLQRVDHGRDAPAAGPADS